MFFLPLNNPLVVTVALIAALLFVYWIIIVWKIDPRRWLKPKAPADGLIPAKQPPLMDVIRDTMNQYRQSRRSIIVSAEEKRFRIEVERAEALHKIDEAVARDMAELNNGTMDYLTKLGVPDIEIARLMGME